MHSHIGILSYARNENEAEKKSIRVIKRQTSNHSQSLWDYFLKYNDDYAYARWDLKRPIRVEQCMDRINDMFDSQQENFKRHLAHLKKAIDKDDQSEIITWSYLLSTKSAYHLFDDEGEAIETNETLQNVLNKYRCIYEDEGKENPLERHNIYFMDFDVHY